MKGKQTSDILYKDNEHMDAFMLFEDKMYDSYNWHYLYYHAPTFASTILVCEDEKKITTNEENEEKKINKFIGSWRKVYDESWMEDSHYWIFKIWYRAYAEQGWWHYFNAFVHYKHLAFHDFPFNFNTVVMYGGKRFIFAKRESYSYGSTNNLDKEYKDVMDGKIYDFSDNRARVILVSPNAIDWYPIFIKSHYYNGNFEHDRDWLVETDNGFYLKVEITERGESSLVYTPLTYDEENRSIKTGETRYFPDYKFDDTSLAVFFTIKDFLFYVDKDYIQDAAGHSIAVRWKVSRFSPTNGENSFSTGNYTDNTYMGAIGYPLGEIKNKVYFYNNKGIGKNWGKMNYYSPEYETIRDSIISIDENGAIEEVYGETRPVWQDDKGYLNIELSHLASIFTNNYEIQYEETTGYFYIYTRMPYNDRNFPKSGGSEFSRIVITKTKDFKNWQHIEAPPYRLLHGRVSQNAAALCLDTAYLEQLKSQYWIYEVDLLNMINYRRVGRNRSYNTTAWCFHNEKPCLPYGIILIGDKNCLKDYNNNISRSTYVAYIHNFSLLESEKDYIASQRGYSKEDGSVVYEYDGQTILNQLCGLDYPGKDT